MDFLEGLWIQQITNSIGGVKYHKKCMKCASCNRKLDSRSFCIDKKEIYCTVCLKKNRLAGQDTPKIHPDTTVIATAEGEKGCPRYDYNSKRSGGKLVFRIMFWLLKDFTNTYYLQMQWSCLWSWKIDS